MYLIEVGGAKNQGFWNARLWCFEQHWTTLTCITKNIGAALVSGKVLYWGGSTCPPPPLSLTLNSFQLHHKISYIWWVTKAPIWFYKNYSPYIKTYKLNVKNVCKNSIILVVFKMKQNEAKSPEHFKVKKPNRYLKTTKNIVSKS